MFLGLVLLPIVGIVGDRRPRRTRRHSSRRDRPDACSPSPVPSGWTGVTIAGTLGLALIGLGFLGSPQIFVRFIALRSTDEIPRGTAVALLWTLLADSGAVLIGMVGRVLLVGPEGDVALLEEGGEAVLPLLVPELMPAFVVGIYIAIVLAAIMSTVDSLLVVAGSALVRDVFQKVMNPELTDDAPQLVRTSRIVTLGLALTAFAVSMAVALIAEDRTIFWFVIFGWSGIAATFCPTIILSLAWKGFTRDGALAAMVTGFLGVPLFKFAAPQLAGVGPYFNELAELPPAFLLSGLVGVGVSLLGGRRAAD